MIIHRVAYNHNVSQTFFLFRFLAHRTLLFPAASVTGEQSATGASAAHAIALRQLSSWFGQLDFGWRVASSLQSKNQPLECTCAIAFPPCLLLDDLINWQNGMSSPRTGAKSPTAKGGVTAGTPSRAHPWVGAELMRRVQHHTGWVYSVSFSPDASLIASCSNDRTVRIFPAANAASDSESIEGVVLNGHSHAIRCCAFNTSGTLLASASWDGDVRVWDVVSGSCVRAISPAAAGNRVYACAWAAPAVDGSEILAAAGGGGGACPVDFSVRMWKFMGDEDAACRVFEGHSKAVTSLAFASDGLRLISSSDDHTVC